MLSHKTPTIISCPLCGSIWNTFLHNACQCGATIKKSMKTTEEIFYETKSAHDSFNVNKKMTEENMKIIYQSMEEYAKQFQPIQPIKLTIENIPIEEVIAIGQQNVCLVGYISCVDGEYICESDESLLKKVTHFILIPEV